MNAVHTLALEFSRSLLEELGYGTLKRVNELNEEDEQMNTCYSHDYCDTNQVMLDTLERLGLSGDPNSVFFMELTEEAWATARENGFYLGGLGNYKVRVRRTVTAHQDGFIVVHAHDLIAASDAARTQASAGAGAWRELVTASDVISVLSAEPYEENNDVEMP